MWKKIEMLMKFIHWEKCMSKMFLIFIAVWIQETHLFLPIHVKSYVFIYIAQVVQEFHIKLFSHTKMMWLDHKELPSKGQ